MKKKKNNKLKANYVRMQLVSPKRHILLAENRIKIENDPDPSDVLLTGFEQHGNITPHLPYLSVPFVL